jgi:putative aldouronate transport system permease protein
MKLKHTSLGYKIFTLLNYLFMFCVVVVILYPFLNIFARSFSSVSELYSGRVTIFPRGFNTAPYELVMNHPNFWTGYRNTIVYTTVGTAISLTLNILAAYSLSKPKLKGKTIFIGVIVFTMIFRPGIIPQYLLINNLGISDSMWAIILPVSLSTFNMIIMRTFFMNFPAEIEEAAMIDGLNPFQILIRIVLPLSKGIIATIVLFYAVDYWNSWFTSLLYIRTNSKKPVTLFLRSIITGAGLDASTSSITTAESMTVVGENYKSAAVMLIAVPIMCVYPFIQKYFTQGVMVGSLKG